MKFMVLLFSLLLQRQTHKMDYERNQVWFERLVKPFDVINLSVKGQVLAYLTAVVLPSVLLWGALAAIAPLFWGLVGFVAQVLVFLYILGRDDYSQHFKQYKACWQRQDYQAAYICAHELLNVDEKRCAASPKQLHQEVTEALIYTWFTRFFVVVFWLLVAGVPGAFGCMLSYWFAQTYRLDWTHILVSALEWIPARILSVSMALAGDFVGSFSKSMTYFTDFHTDSKTVLLGSAQLNESDSEFSVSEAQDKLSDINQLMIRCAIIWLLMAAFFTIFGRL